MASNGKVSEFVIYRNGNNGQTEWYNSDHDTLTEAEQEARKLLASGCRFAIVYDNHGRDGAKRVAVYGTGFSEN